VINASNAQATFFDTSGVHVLSYQNILPDGSRIRLLAGGARGWFAADDSLFSRRAQQRLGQATQTAVAIKRINPAWIQTAVVSRSAADSLLTPIVTYRGPRIFGMLGSEGGSEQFVLGNPPFFEPSPSYAIDDRDHVYLAPGWPYVVDVYDLNGALIRRITRAHDSLPVTDDLKAEVLRRARTFYDSTSQQRGATYHTYSERAKMPVVGFLPVIRSILASSEGWIWVRRMDTHDDPAALESPGSQAPRSTAWDIFEPTGRFWATVRLPPRFSPFVVFPDAVVGVQRDELDIEYIVRYDLIGPRGDVP
jgi:hypothetical protein